MSVEIVTYANKSQGMFEELINNKFGIPIKVLGWGTEWKGFSDKTKGVIKHLETKNDDDIVVYLDGFDTKINKNSENVKKFFESYECKVLFSNNPPWFFQSFMFGTCDNSIANAGLYMGYVKELKQVLKDELLLKCEDDQHNFNKLCNKYDFIKVDKDEKIFKNFSPLQNEIEVESIFISYPGAISTTRYLRGFVEYTQFFYFYVVLSLLGGMYFLPKHRQTLVFIIMIYTAFFVGFADKSCTSFS